MPPNVALRWCVCVLAVGAVLLIAAPAVLMIMAFTSGSSELAAQECSGTSVGSAASVAGAEGLSSTQRTNAATVISVGSQMQVPARGILVALAVAHQESGFLNYANDGQGGDLQSDQIGLQRSLGIPHDAVGTDHGSLGIFQQQWPWWGTMEELMTPATAAEKFYERLIEVPGWQELPVTVAGQRVQRSAYPDAYADDEALAVRLLGDGDVIAAAEGSGGSLDFADCLAPAEFAGGVVAPIADGAVDQHNFGGSGSMWSRQHTGTDLSAACGTPVVAAHDGVAVVRTDHGWAGRWLLQISTGEGRLATWYAHMQQLDVRDGQRVRAGQSVGRVGTLGNSTGCHLHFEVHPQGGSIYEDPVDPSNWLEKHQQQDIEAVSATASTSASADYLVGTFNVLGHSHTEPGGKRSGWRPSMVRTRGVVRLVDGYGLSVVGFQEFQPIQKRAFLRLAGDRYQVHSPGGDTVNSIAWHRGRFALVSADSLPIPYFNGQIRQMPVVRLRDRLTGEDSIYINVHNPADTRRFHRQGRFRAEAIRRERAAVHSIHERYGLPVFLMGDLNSIRPAFCALTRGGLLRASAGGSTGPRCVLPRQRAIDWIFATSTNWAGHWSIRDGVRGTVSDHPLVLARVRVGGQR